MCYSVVLFHQSPNTHHVTEMYGNIHRTTDQSRFLHFSNIDKSYPPFGAKGKQKEKVDTKCSILLYAKPSIKNYCLGIWEKML